MRDEVKDSTAYGYLLHLTRFLEETDRDTESLFEEHRSNVQESRDGDPRAVKRIPFEVSNYMERLIESGLKSGSVQNTYKVLTAFFRANELPFNGSSPPVESESIPTISTSQLNTLIELTGQLRFKALILTAKDSGLRVGDLTALTLGHYLNAHRNTGVDGREYLTFEYTTQKTGSTANPVLGPESIAMIERWLTFRESKGLPMDNESPLFCSVRSVKGFTDSLGHERRSATAGGFVSQSTFGVSFRHLVKKAGLKETGISIHSCRKFHKTNLEYAGVLTSWINRMQGRKGIGSGGIYTRPNPDQLIEIYSGGYSGLSLETDSASMTSKVEKMERETSAYMGTALDLERENEELKARIEQLENGASQESKLREMILKMKAEGLI